MLHDVIGLRSRILVVKIHEALGRDRHWQRVLDLGQSFLERRVCLRLVDECAFGLFGVPACLPPVFFPLTIYFPSTF
jgi:hypothetical protein